MSKQQKIYLIAEGILALIALFLFIPAISWFFVALFGYAVYAYVLLALVINGMWLAGKSVNLPPQKLLLYLALFLSFIATLHIMLARSFVVAGVGEFIGAPFQRKATVGGSVISLVATPLVSLFGGGLSGYIGALVVFFILTAGLGLTALLPLFVEKDGGQLRHHNISINTEPSRLYVETLERPASTASLPQTLEDLRPELRRFDTSILSPRLPVTRKKSTSEQILFGDAEPQTSAPNSAYSTPHASPLPDILKPKNPYPSPTQRQTFDENPRKLQFADLDMESEFKARYGNLDTTTPDVHRVPVSVAEPEQAIHNAQDEEVVVRSSVPQKPLQSEQVSFAPAAPQFHTPKPSRPYVAPPIELLKNMSQSYSTEVENYGYNKEILERTMQEIGVAAEVFDAAKGPSFTRYMLRIAAGSNLKKVQASQDTIMMRLKVKSVRILAPIRGMDALGVEIPNQEREMVGLRQMLTAPEYYAKRGGIQLVFGKTLDGKAYIGDLVPMPHLMIAGATNTGKSVGINAVILSILYRYSPEDVRLILIDPKRVELSVYRNLPHMLIPNTVCEPQQAVNALKWLTEEMDRRFKFFNEAGAVNIDHYNDDVRAPHEAKMHRIVLIVDEMADLMMQSKAEIEGYIVRIAQLARACGIHLIIATQRPTVNVITGLIKANIPHSIAFTVKTGQDSRIILDEMGAENLLGKGDMLYACPSEPEPVRLQGAFVTPAEIKAVADFIREHNTADFDASIDDAIMQIAPPKSEESEFDEADEDGASTDYEELVKRTMKLFMDDKRPSINWAQMHLGIGYQKAAKIVYTLEQRGHISAQEGAKPRKILLTPLEFQEYYGD
jgi:DNA segregation ATPase FtsK/SpoIIIE-like protein